MSLGKKVLNTKRWGKLEIDLDEEISFERGIPGFEENKRFVLLDSDDIKPFYWLVNIEDPDLAFVLVDPQNFLSDYQPKIYESDMVELKSDPNDTLMIFAMITLSSDPVKSTANLLGPLLINITKKLGKQIVVVDEQYSTKCPILNVSAQKVVEHEQLEVC